MRFNTRWIAGIVAVAAAVVLVLLITTIWPARGKRVLKLPDGVQVTTQTARAANWPATWPASDPLELRRRLDQLVADCKKRGEPILPEDFRVKPGDELQNPAASLQAAGGLVAKANPEGLGDFHLPAAQMSATQRRLMQQAATKLAPALALVDEAETRHGVADWHVKIESPAVATLLPSLNESRQLALVFGAASLSAHRAGRDAEAVHRISQIVMLAKASDTNPFLISHLVSIRIVWMAYQTVEDIVPTLDAAQSRSEMEALIARLLDDGWMHDALRYVVYAERMSYIDAATALADGRLTMASLLGASPNDPQTLAATRFPPPPGVVMEDGRAVAEHLTALLAAVDAERLPDFQRRLPARPRVRVPPMGPSNMNPAGSTHYAGVAYLRLAASALAVRCWMADHGQALPASLEQLTPRYLPAVPDDPMALAPAKIKFQAGSAASVSSVGRDRQRNPLVVHLTPQNPTSSASQVEGN